MNRHWNDVVNFYLLFLNLIFNLFTKQFASEFSYLCKFGVFEIVNDFQKLVIPFGIEQREGKRERIVFRPEMLVESFKNII